MYRPEPHTRRGSSRQEPGSSQEPGSWRDPCLAQRQTFHDAANWLTVLLGHVEALREAPDPERFERHRELARRAARAAHRLCALPPGEGRSTGIVDPLPYARRLVAHVRASAAEAGVEVAVVADSPPQRVVADPSGFDDAVLNLLRNAIEATPAGGRVQLRIGAAGPGFVGVFVEDEGPGIEEGLRERLGKPGQSTKTGDDRGLGLSRVRAWLESSGACLEVGHSANGSGASIGFSLPVAAETAPMQTPVAGALRILLVEDDVAVAEVLALLLGADGHPVVHQPDVQEALASFVAGTFDLILCDENLPDGSGMELLAKLGAADPAITRFLVTGDPELVNSAAPGTIDGVLAKPVSRDDLRRAVSLAQATEGANSSDQARAGDA
jgi:CheY-like chemotaxis protein